ncbi:MAG: TonB-dependent receptor, partial [Pseudomonadota bacterium]
EDETAVQETIIITGARGAARSVSDSPVPIDVFAADDIEAVSFTDTNDILKTLVPSYSLTRQPISDGASFIRPAALRGLPTDKTLVLVNSKRRHRAALVQIGGSGTQGPDIATIPAIALANVEVLRDGAAAQYGSDAIAGVINFILKDSSEGATFTYQAGQYFEEDGFDYTMAANIGLPLGDAGFINLSAEITEQNASVRGEQYCESFACVDANDSRFLSGSGFDDSLAGFDEETFIAGLPDANIGFGDFVQPWGQPNLEAARFFVNSGYKINQYADLYAFGSYSMSESDGSFFYRYPGNGTIEDLRLEDGSLWSPLSIFPGGFTPRFRGDVFDRSFVGGLKGELDNGFAYDLSARAGESEVQYTLQNTINPSLGPDTPTSFRPGDLINDEYQLQADFSQEFDLGLSGPVVFAFGATYLDESYTLVEGEEASYIPGPFAAADPFGLCDATTRTPTAKGAGVADLNCANFTTADDDDDDIEDDGIPGLDPVYRVVGVGSNGFPGYSPEFSDSYSRDSVGIYADLSADVTDDLFVQGALRFEDYSDFGEEVVWKLAGQYDVTDAISVRGSVGTGFRAPSPGQQGTTNVSTRLPNGFPVATGLFPAAGPVAGALGATPLEPEKSNNIAFGVTGGFADFTFTVDAYRIELQDRINAISTQDVSTNPNDGTAYDNFLALQAAGVVGAESIGGVFYFTNAFDTVTQGVDFVGTYEMDWANGSSTSFTGSINYNTEEFDGDVGDLFNIEAQADFENGTPNWRGVFTVVHETGPFTILARANYFGSYEQTDSAVSDGIREITATQEFDPVVQFDLEGTYDINDIFSITVGARNIFDQYPDEGDFEVCCGRIYRSDSIVDWQGGYYYTRLAAKF